MNIDHMGFEQEVERSDSPLQILEIERNDICFSAHTARNLNYVLKYGNLTSINISYNNLGDSGVIKLSKGLGGKISLRRLEMKECKITLIGAHEFFENMGLNASI